MLRRLLLCEWWVCACVCKFSRCGGVEKWKRQMESHTLNIKRPCQKWHHQRETEGREHHREVQQSKTEVVWTCEETRPIIRRKKDSGDGTTWEKKKKTEAEMDGLSQPRHESYRDNKTWSPWQNWLEENCVCCAATRRRECMYWKISFRPIEVCLG